MSQVHPTPVARATIFSSLCFLLCIPSVSANRYPISGAIHDRTSGQPIPAANVRVMGTSRGTIANESGRYSLLLDAGPSTLVYSSLGYRPDTIVVNVAASMVRNVDLVPADITLPEIIVTAEDPAIEIMRRAIARKHQWIDRLMSYTFSAFTRQALFRDTSIASIAESFTSGYWRQGDTLREIMTHGRQTQNIQQQFNFASVGQIVNFNDDAVRFAGYTFVGPTAPDALDYYDYKLLRTYAIQGQEAYDIRMIPRSRITPLFVGTVTITAGTYALAGVDVEPNEAFILPMIEKKSIRYRQQFGLYDSLFWMPSDIRIDASVTIGILGLRIPPIGFHRTSVVTDYRINVPIPDSIFTRSRLVMDSSASRPDSAFWATNVVLPLNPVEQEAYRTLDSTKTLDVQFRPNGAAMTLGLGDSSSLLFTALSLVDFTFNRVEGLHLGAAYDFDSLIPRATLSAGAAYEFTRRRWTSTGGVTFYPLASRKDLGIGGTVYSIIDNVPDQGYYAAGSVGLAALLGGVDYRDYFLARGWNVFISSAPARMLSMRIGFSAEREGSEQKRTDYTLFSRSHLYPENPSIQDGMLHSLTATVRIGPEHIPLDLLTQNALEISAEQASSPLLGGDFTFTRFSGVLTVMVPTFGRSYLFPPSLRLRLSGGTSFGTLPPQRIFAVESQLDGYAPFGSMRAGEPRELTGAHLVSLSVEHNFRSLPFLALGIPFLYNNTIELIAHGGVARVWGYGPGAPPSSRFWYTEAGFGISRILQLLRVDFTWRLSAPRRFALSLGIAEIV